MWQLYAILSLFGSAGESVVDKTALVADRRVDHFVATFLRLCVLTIFALSLGYLGVMGNFELIFPPVILLVGVLTALNAIFNTYLLRHVEVTGIGAMYYLAPFLFLLIDTSVLHMQLSPQEIAGIILLVLGGVGFAVDGKTHHFKRELSPLVWAMFIYGALLTGFEGYVFKYLNASQGTTPISFFASYFLVCTVALLLLLIHQRKMRLLRSASARTYLPYIVISKSFGTFGNLMWAQALVTAAVSQVSAMQALEPLALFVVTVLVQDFLRFRVGERLGARRFRWKAVSVSLLVLGGLLVT